MLARPLVAAAVLVAAGVGSVLVAGGTSAADAPVRVAPAPVRALPAAPPALVGPSASLPLAVAARSAVGPPVPHGLPRLPPVVVVPPGPPLGPRVGPLPMGPSGVVGPGSPVSRVRAVQRLLNRNGAALRVDGAWGPATARAVSAVQVRAGLPVTGRADAQTLAVLRAQPADRGA